MTTNASVDALGKRVEIASHHPAIIRPAAPGWPSPSPPAPRPPPAARRPKAPPASLQPPRLRDAHRVDAAVQQAVLADHHPRRVRELEADGVVLLADRR